MNKKDLATLRFGIHTWATTRHVARSSYRQVQEGRESGATGRDLSAGLL